jgi:hypothetical protein
MTYVHHKLTFVIAIFFKATLKIVLLFGTLPRGTYAALLRFSQYDIDFSSL